MSLQGRTGARKLQITSDKHLEHDTHYCGILPFTWIWWQSAWDSDSNVSMAQLPDSVCSCNTKFSLKAEVVLMTPASTGKKKVFLLCKCWWNKACRWKYLDIFYILHANLCLWFGSALTWGSTVRSLNCYTNNTEPYWPVFGFAILGFNDESREGGAAIIQRRQPVQRDWVLGDFAGTQFAWGWSRPLCNTHTHTHTLVLILSPLPVSLHHITLGSHFEYVQDWMFSPNWSLWTHLEDIIWKYFFFTTFSFICYILVVFVLLQTADPTLQCSG